VRPIQHVEVVRVIPHPALTVFHRYADHVGWSDWAGLGPVRLVRAGSPETNGVGSVRAFSVAPGLREEVTVFVPPERIEYRITQGLLPIADHHGMVSFAPEGRGLGQSPGSHDGSPGGAPSSTQGTRVTWRTSFRSSIPGLGWPIERGLEAMFRRMLAGLARDLDRAGDG
jgi:hypothetical protein